MPKQSTERVSITRSDVEHVAMLARLALTEDEVSEFAEQLTAILGHATNISSLDLEDVPPTAHPLPVINVLRADVIGSSLDRDEVLAAAPAAEEGRFRVPRIMGEA